MRSTESAHEPSATPTPSAALVSIGIPIDYDSRQYWEGCLERRLLVTRCDQCGFWIHFPRHICPKCWGERVTPQEVSGQATLFSFVLYVQPGGDGYPVALVDLVEQEGLRLPCTVTDVPSSELVIGMPLELTWNEWRGVPVPAFGPVQQRRSGQTSRASQGAAPHA